MTKINLNEVEKFIDKKKILNKLNFSLDLTTPKIYGFVGPNGAGKTTTMKLLSGLYLQDKGKISFEGVEGEYFKWAKENIAYIGAGERGLFYKNTVYDNAMYYGVLKGTSPKVLKRNIKEYAEKLDFLDQLFNRIEQLSTGQKKKAQLICAISCGKKIMLLDEPSLGLDIDSTVELQNLIQETQESLSVTFFISSHNTNFLSKIAKNYYFIFKGTIVDQHYSEIETIDLENKYYELKKRYE